MNEKSKPFASLQIGQSTETPVVDIYRDSKTDHGMIKDHEDGTWIRLEDYVALNRQLTSALAREKELREENARRANLAHRIYNQLGNNDVWDRTTAGGSAELDYIQDELERCKPALTKPTP